MFDILRIIYYIQTYQRWERRAVGEVSRLQRKKLERLVAYARKKSPFFTRLYKGIPEKDFRLEQLPPVNKKTMMENFNDYLTDRTLKKDKLREFVLNPANVGKKYKGYVVFHTSGTTGEPAIIIYDQRAFDHIKAINMARSRREKITLSTILRTLFVHKSRLSIILMDGGLYPAYSNVVHRPRLTSLFVNLQVLSLRSPIDELVGKLNAFQPDVLMGYPSIIMALAYEQIAGRMNILNGPEIHTVATLSEPLSEHARSVINRAFPCPLVNIYGSGECLTIAKSCLKGSNMHVNHDLAILEIVDREGRPVPPGQFGHKVYLTNLENYVQPFIRYEITDVTAWDDKTCNCGITLPLIKDVSSRTDDILYVRNPEGSYQIVHPYWIMVPLLHIHAIKEYQVIQSERNALDVSLVLHEGQSMDLSLVEQSLRDSLSSSKVAAEIALNVKSVAKITPDPKSGKIRRIHSAVGPPKDLDYLIE